MEFFIWKILKGMKTKKDKEKMKEVKRTRNLRKKLKQENDMIVYKIENSWQQEMLFLQSQKTRKWLRDLQMNLTM